MKQPRRPARGALENERGRRRASEEKRELSVPIEQMGVASLPIEITDLYRIGLGWYRGAQRPIRVRQQREMGILGCVTEALLPGDPRGRITVTQLQVNTRAGRRGGKKVRNAA